MARTQKPHQLSDVRGNPMIERRGAKVSSLGHDAYHVMRTASWTRLMLLFGAAYLIANFLFAVAYWATGAKVINSDGFHDLYWFSVQTMATIGYGYLAPGDDVANAIVTVQSFVGIVMAAIITGIFFSRFSTPRARVLFGRKAIVGTYDGQRSLLFRMANERSTAIVEASIRAYIVRDDKLANGEFIRRVHDLTLRRSTSPIFALSFLATHVIDDKSPLVGATADSLRGANINIVVTFTGIDDSLAASVHARYMWTPADIVFDHRFVDIFSVDAVTGKRYLDLGPLHDTEPVAPPTP